MLDELSVFARKKLLIGIILMSGLISTYEYFTVGFENIGFFRVFIPVFWVVFSIVSVVIVSMSRGDRSVYMARTYEFKNNLILWVCNIITVILMVYIYVAFSKEDMDVSYWSSRSVYTTLMIVLLMLFYMIGGYRKFRVNPKDLIKYSMGNTGDTEPLSEAPKKETKEVKDKPFTKEDIDVIKQLNSGDKYSKAMNDALGRKGGFMVTPVVLNDDDESTEEIVPEEESEDVEVVTIDVGEDEEDSKDGE